MTLSSGEEEEYDKDYAGKLRIQLVEARNLAPPETWLNTGKKLFQSNMASSCNPFVEFDFTEGPVQTKRSQTIYGTTNPSWFKDMHTMYVPKRHTVLRHQRKRSLPTQIVASQAVPNTVHMSIDVFSEDSITKKAGAKFGITEGGTAIGSAIVDVTNLVDGSKEFEDKYVHIYPNDLIPAESKQAEDSFTKKDTKVKGKRHPVGEIRVLLQYEPIGLEPQLGDIARLEGYGIHPDGILPDKETLALEVVATNGSYILGKYTTDCGFEAFVRLHRYCVYVYHRNCFLDRVYSSLVTTPLEIVQSMPVAQRIESIMAPYVNMAWMLAAPGYYAMRGTILTAFRASSAATRAIFHGQ